MRIRIQDSQINADPDPQHCSRHRFSKTLTGQRHCKRVFGELEIRIRMFLGLPDPDQDPIVRGTDPDPAPSTGTVLQQEVQTWGRSPAGRSGAGGGRDCPCRAAE
jgi:hypothetical protein